MAETDRDLSDFENLFRAARDQHAVLPQDLEDRIIADGLQVQRSRLSVAAPRVRTVGRWKLLLDVLGGWPAMGGMAAACAAGVWLGLAPPQALPDPMQLVQAGESNWLVDDDLALAMVEE
ncbi:hypothetical protein I5535_05235 [Rhodobacteraceae bacterium F11138]|nr:hypothetical protein [Rhodobacteraceae bacterium F11138]